MPYPSNPSLLTSGGDAVGGASHVTASCTPSGARSTFLAVLWYSRGSSTNPAEPSSISGMGLTWAAHATGAVMGSISTSATRTRGMVWMATGVPTSGALTITHGWTLAAGERCHWNIIEIPGAELRTGVSQDPASGVVPFNAQALPNGATGTGSGISSVSTATSTSPTSSTEWQGANHSYLHIGCLFASATVNPSTITPPTGWTALGNDNTRLATFYATGKDLTAGWTATFGVASGYGTITLEFFGKPRGVRYVGADSTRKATGATTVNTAWPAGYTPQDGDRGYIFIAGRSYGNSGLTTPSGWTRDEDYNASSGSLAAVLLSREIAAGDSAPSLVFSNTWMNFGNGYANCILFVLRGVRLNAYGGWQQVAPPAAVTGSGTSISTASVAPSGTDAEVLTLNAARGSGINTTTSLLKGGHTTVLQSSTGTATVGGSYSVMLRPARTANTVAGTTVAVSSSQLYWSRTYALAPAGESFITPNSIVGPVVVSATVGAASAGPYLTPNPVIGPIQVSASLSVSTPPPKPRREYLWVAGMDGVRENVIT